MTNTKRFKRIYEDRMKAFYSDDPETRFYAYLNSRQRYFADMLLLNRLDEKLTREGY